MTELATSLTALVGAPLKDLWDVDHSFEASLAVLLRESLKPSLWASLRDSLARSLVASLGTSLRDSLWDSLCELAAVRD